MGRSSKVCAIERRLIPWWWAMKERTTAWFVPGSNARGRVVDGLVEPEVTQEAAGAERLQVAAGFPGHHGQRESRGVGGDHQVVGQSAS